jgi:predicted dinucleotide-binding enzyme
LKIAILGAGNVGSALGTRWARLGHTVTFGVRDPYAGKVQALLIAAGGNASATAVAGAATGAEVVALATSWAGAADALSQAGDLSGKVLIDCTNPFVDGALALGHTSSGAERVAGWAPEARVVKAFNTTGSGNMLDADYQGTRPTMFLCGDDAGAKTVTAGLAQELGFEPCDCGPLTVARYLEPMAGLWVQLAYREGLGKDIAFKLLRR